MVHTALAGIPGMYGLGGGPGAGSPFGVYRPATVPSDLVPQYVHVAGQNTVQVDSVAPDRRPVTIDDPRRRSCVGAWHRCTTFGGRTDRRAPLGAVVGTRSGDKGGDANLGVYVRTDDGVAVARRDAHRRTAPRAAARDGRTCAIDRYRFPKLRSLNFVIRGLLDEGVAASTRQDAQAKALGEWLRSRVVDIPAAPDRAVTPRTP